jgi:hypothetical protein
MNDKHKQLMALLSRAGIDEQTRHDLVRGWTAGRTNSSKGLTIQELTDIVWKLQNDSSFAQNIRSASEALLQIQLKKKRTVILTIAQRIGLHSGTDFTRFNSFMQNSSVLHKKLQKYTLEELDVLTKQFRAIEQNYNRSAATAGTKAWQHNHGFSAFGEN